VKLLDLELVTILCIFIRFTLCLYLTCFDSSELLEFDPQSPFAAEATERVSWLADGSSSVTAGGSDHGTGNGLDGTPYRVHR
jgi:hypothetical protein